MNAEKDEVYDIVKRPNMVFDILPFHLDNDKITILAKHAYPRPLANIHSDSASLDGKYSSGYITELLTIAATDNIKAEINRRFAIGNYNQIDPSLNYYTSSGGINERVSSFFVSLNNAPSSNQTIDKNLSGFNTSGSIYSYDATQLLNTAQTGALIEARLELNIYNLFFTLQIPLPKWLGQKLPIQKIDKINVSSLDHLFSLHTSVYSASADKADFLQSNRAYFSEIGIADSNNILEYVYPKHLSSNTLVTLPICRKDDEIYVGLEVRELPVPQLYRGNSTLIVAPAQRLRKNITDMHTLQTHLSEVVIGDAKIVDFAKLGEKYYPSVGVTTEQVYPYVVSLDYCTSELHWIPLKELYNNLSRIEDAHLLISICRLIHTVGK